MLKSINRYWQRGNSWRLLYIFECRKPLLSDVVIKRFQKLIGFPSSYNWISRYTQDNNTTLFEAHTVHICAERYAMPAGMRDNRIGVFPVAIKVMLCLRISVSAILIYQQRHLPRNRFSSLHCRYITLYTLSTAQFSRNMTCLCVCVCTWVYAQAYGTSFRNFAFRHKQRFGLRRAYIRALINYRTSLLWLYVIMDIFEEELHSGIGTVWFDKLKFLAYWLKYYVTIQKSLVKAMKGGFF